MRPFEPRPVSRSEMDATAGRYVNLMTWTMLGVLTGIHFLLVL